MKCEFKLGTAAAAVYFIFGHILCHFSQPAADGNPRLVLDAEACPAVAGRTRL
jgi:hypothetical protein